MPPDVHADTSSPGPSPSRGRPMYPMLLDVSGRRIVVVGGGAVALRKVNGLIDAGASAVSLRVVAPRHRHGFPPGVVLVEEEYRGAHLSGAELVFAATDSAAVNRQVVLDAQGRGLLVC